MRTWLRWQPLVGLVLLLGGCGGKGGNEDDGVASASEDDSVTAGGTATTSEPPDTGDTGTATGAPVDCDGAPDYTATADVLDEGLGPIAAPVTIANCGDATAYVYQDCCYGAAFQLERKDASDAPWRTSMPSVACDCAGPLAPLEIAPGTSIAFDTQPSSFDSEPICEDPYFAIYRWTFLVGPEPDCDECWQSVPTNEFSWYCEG